VATTHSASVSGTGAPVGDTRPAAPVGTGDPSRGGLGILGGSFNPPHRGHVELARHVLRELGLERVLLMPARVSPGKPVEDEPYPAHPQHRLEMCRLAATGVEGVEACGLEIGREGPSYTVDTLRALHARHPEIALTFILGADVASTLSYWHEAAELPALASFAVALRVGGRPIIEPDRVDFPIIPLHMPMIDASSSLVRERVRRGLPVEELVGRSVASYIAEHALYRGSDLAGAGEAGGVGTASGDVATARGQGGGA
jgi:nicotinate-nucleotide adenylyltransferase